ncbi:MAG: ComEC/Rec2 family competence protein [Bacteroidales bacterium]
MLYKEIPFLVLSSALAAGIIAGSLLPFSILYLPITLSLFVILAIGWIRGEKRHSPSLTSLPLTLFLLLAGIILYQSSIERVATLPPGNSRFVLRADDLPEQRENSVRLPVTIIEVNDKRIRSHTNRMMLYYRNFSSVEEIRPGTCFETALTPRQITDPDTLDNFNYPLYMLRRGFRYYAFSSHEVTITPGRPGIKNLSARTRISLTGILSDHGLENDRLALAAALTLGYRELLDTSITESFRLSGITHILAVSGLHVGILSMLVLGLLSLRKGRSGVTAVIITVIAIWCFALVTGLSPSVTRASIMFTFLHAGRLIQRPVNNINSLLASAFIVLAASPGSLFDVGFQLSYSAVLFILLFFRDLRNLLPARGVIAEKLWSMTAVTILAQLGTLPFVIYYFRSLPLLSVLANLVAIPSAFIILGGSLLVIITSPLPIIPVVAARIVGITSALLINAAGKFARLPIASLQVSQVTEWTFFSLLILVPLTTSFMLKKGSVHPHILLFSLITGVVVSVFN